MSYQRRKAYEAAKDMMDEGYYFTEDNVAYCIGVEPSDYGSLEEFSVEAWEVLLDVLKEDSE